MLWIFLWLFFWCVMPYWVLNPPLVWCWIWGVKPLQKGVKPSSISSLLLVFFSFFSKTIDKDLHLLEILIEAINLLFSCYPNLSRCKPGPNHPFFVIIWSSFFLNTALNQFSYPSQDLETLCYSILSQNPLQRL